ncbi:MAG: hypothetical protein ABJM43_12515 [Paracoccaceae bacterium]
MLLLTALFSLALLLGFAGKLHPFFDAIAAGRWFAVFGLMVSLNVYFLSIGRYWAGIISFSLLTAFGASLVISPDGESGSVRVYSKNLFFRNSETSGLVADIQAADPDIVVLQEVSVHNQAVLTELKKRLLIRQFARGRDGMELPFYLDGRYRKPDQPVRQRDRS